MRAARKTAAVVALACAAVAYAPSRAQPQGQVNLQGVWDLNWVNDRGAQRRGYLRLEQEGTTLRAEIHGRTSINAHGTVRGHAFELRGSRMMIPYRAHGQVQGNRMEGVFRVLNVERHFVGTRRTG